jgi:uncharacterized protein (DUF433 family)
MTWQERIHADPQILLGKPVIKGTRIAVELIVELFEKGWTQTMILESYPTLTVEDLQAVFAYLGDCLRHELYFPFALAA